MLPARGWFVWGALSLAAAAAALTIHAQTPSQDPARTPSFRADVNLVRVDVLATDRSGRPLDTLTADDFEIRENGVRQTISSFRHVSLNGDRDAGGDAIRAITSGAIEETEAAREDVRLFAVLLDDYHVKRESSLWVRDQLARFVETQLGPADMIGVVYPLEAMADMRLTRDLASAQAALRRFSGRKHNYWPQNEIEQRYVFRLSTEEIERTRTRVTLGALEALIARLGTLKEGRKSLILVTEGFANSLPPALVAYHGGLGGPTLPAVPPGASPGVSTPDSRTFFNSVDLDMDLREITDLANRQNVSIYTVDPRGLGASEYGGDLPEVDGRTDRMYLQMTQTTLKLLAENTDGRAILNRNDITVAMKQIVSDSSAYYLLGYVSTQPASDGRFHPIDVRVKRAGIELRHRRGYWARTAEEVARASTTSAAPAPSPVADAIGAVRARDSRLIQTWVRTAPGDAGSTQLTFVWETSARGTGATGARPARVLLGASARDEAYFLGRVPEKPNPPATRGSVAFDVPPGPLELRISVEDANGLVLDSETRPVVVPDFDDPRTSFGSPELFRARTAQETARMKNDPKAIPTASPVFSRSEHLWVRLPLYGASTKEPAAGATLVSPAGATISELHADATSQPRAVMFDVPIANLAPAEYAVIVTTLDSQAVLAFRITP